MGDERKIADTIVEQDSSRQPSASGSLHNGEQTRPFLQPLAVALVCLIFISLLLIRGLTDLRNLDRTLVDYIEKSGVEIIKNVQQVADYHFQRLVQTGQAGLDSGDLPHFTEETFSMQELLLSDLVELAQEIDIRLEEGRLSHKQLGFIAEKESLWLIALLDERGVITFQHRPVPRDLLSLADPIIQGNEEIKISIFGPNGISEGLKFIALLRKSGSGTIILALDREGFRHRSLKVSIQRAIEEVGQVSGTIYFAVTDQLGRILGRVGELPRIGREKGPDENILEGGVEQASRKIVLNGQELLEIVAPIHLAEGTIGAARLSLARYRADRIVEKIRFRVFVSLGFMVIIASLSMWLLYKNQNRHLARMREMERRLQKSERLSALGRLSAGVAHEIRNPLNAISMASQRIDRDNPNQLTGVIQDEIRRLNQIIEEFLGFSRSRKLEFCRHDLTELLDDIVLLMEEKAKSEGIAIHTGFMDSTFVISMDPDKLKQALLNIMKNAVESISPTGSINLSVEPKGKEWVSVKISDTGAGLSDEEIEKIFDLDYTTKEKGLGLGLPLAHEIIQGHGGEIQVRSQPGSGTTFEILLPLDREAHRPYYNS